MVSAKDVQALNKKIESISQQRMKTETQQEMLKKRLTQEVAEYKQQFGVNLQGKTFTSTKSLIMEEAKKVTSEVEAEYELKEKIVNAIESGDIDTAYALLGIERVKPEPETVEEVVEEVAEEIAVEEVAADMSVMLDDFGDLEEETTEEVSPAKADAQAKEPEEDFDFDFGMGADDEETESEPEKPEEFVEGVVFDDFGMGSDDEEPVKPAKPEMLSAKDAFADLLMDSDDDDSSEPMDLGFGSMLNGTKFGQ